MSLIPPPGGRVNSGAGKFLDLVANREPVGISQILAIVTAVILGYLDQAIHFSDDPLLTTLIVYGVSSVVAALWARSRAWSPASVAKLSGRASPEVPPGGH